jgi:hypothetical protein
MLGGFPADLAAETGLIAGGLEVREFFEEIEQDGFDKVPVLGATGKECEEPEFVAAEFSIMEKSLAQAGEQSFLVETTSY